MRLDEFILVLSTIVIFVTANDIASVSGITTNVLPDIISDNNTNNVQLIQSLLQQPTSAFLIHHNSGLSPLQQSQIFDDIRKNQKIQIQPSGASFSDRQKSLFGSGLQAVPLPQESGFFPSNRQIIYESHPNRYTEISSPGSTSSPSIIFASQPPPQLQNNYLTAFRPPPSPEYNYRQILSPIYENTKLNSVTQYEPLKIREEQYFPVHQTPSSIESSSKAQYIHQTETGSSIFPLQDNDQLYNSYKFGTTLKTVSGNQYQNHQPTGPTLIDGERHQSDYSNINQGTAKPKVVIDKSVNHVNSVTPTTDNKIVKEIYVKTNPEILIARDRQKFFQQLLEGRVHSNSNTSTNSNDQTPDSNDLKYIKTEFEKELLRQLQSESNGVPQLNLDNEALRILASNLSGVSEIKLPNGQKIQISRDYNKLADSDLGSSSSGIKTFVVKPQLTPTANTKPSEAILAELTKGVVPPGTDFELIRRNKDGALEEVNNLPQNLPQKKVTFVILEEQPDGSVKVQGVRGSEKDSLKESGEEVDSIIRKIKEGQLKLPPSTKLSTKSTATEQNNAPTYVKQSTSHSENNKVHSKSGHPNSDNRVNNKDKKYENQSGENQRIKNKNKNSADISSDNDVLRALKHKDKPQFENRPFLPTPLVDSYPSSETFSKSNYYTASPGSSVAFIPSSNGNYYIQDDKLLNGNYFIQNTIQPATETSTKKEYISDNEVTWKYGNKFNTHEDSSPYEETSTFRREEDNLSYMLFNGTTYIPTDVSNFDSQTSNIYSSVNTPSRIHPSQLPFIPTTLPQNEFDSTNSQNADTLTTISGSRINSGNYKYPNSEKNRYKSMQKKQNRRPSAVTNHIDNEENESIVEESPEMNLTLSDILKTEGFYAMAKFLKQSGLDTILNDTGPFTLFIPTDKAFRTLLIQLGGPDRAEEKFKDNPRLLSGLLLHHVIPGAFKVGSLQDEMTGVSLAGTQLRVNTYTTHDIEWNDVKVVTVNGAKILDVNDIIIPQGIAHSVDRVMFPLPVGNLLQSLQADRENRYSNFLKIIEESGLSQLFTGSKTFTVFAPLNRAFTNSEYGRVSSDPKEAKSFVLKHIIPGALYSAGMKYYQVRDSMDESQQITLYKEAGRIKVNSAHVITRNTPTTNGVIHAIDSPL